MRLRGLSIFAGVVLLSAAAFAQMQGSYSGYLDVSIFKVKPEKRAEFDALSKKMAEANHKHKGDSWLASEVVYGEGNTIIITSARQSYAEAEKSMGLFMGAMVKAAGGPAAAAKLLQDGNSTIASSRAELRIRRDDLTSNPPADAQALLKLIGETQWLRTTTIRVRPGRGPEFEEQLKAVKRARENDMAKATRLVSQALAGQQGGVYYLTTAAKSMADFDTDATPLPKLLGEEGFQKYLKVISETVISTETYIHRYLPELSNPPEEVAAAAPNFWHPKPAVTTKAKAAEAGSKTP
jgi:hypothetical protein